MTLTMRTAPCPSAPAVQVAGSDLVLTSSDEFTFADKNSAQRSACGQFGFAPEDTTTCWIQVSFNGVLGREHTSWNRGSLSSGQL